MNLPPEILIDVFSLLDKQDLAASRLVCTAFESVATPLLFDSVSISSNYASFTTAKSIIHNFNSSIKTINFCPVFYHALTKRKYMIGVEKKCKAEGLQTCPKHSENAYKTYCRLTSEQRDITQDSKYMATLNAAFMTCKNAVKLVFGAIERPTNIMKSDMMKLGLSRDMLCLDRDCSLEDYRHLLYFIAPETCYRRPMSELWYPAMTALAASNSGITEIDMNRSECWSWKRCLSIDAFNSVKPKKLYHPIRQRLNLLTKLHLDIGYMWNNIVETTCYYGGDLARALSTAHNIESLHLRLRVHAPNWGGSWTTILFAEFRMILRGCYFPKLRSLLLQSLEGSEVEVLSLLQKSPHLEDLCLCDFSLKSGSWQNLAEQIRDALQLRKVLLMYLRSPHHSNDQQDWFLYSHDYHRKVDDFFFDNGENPFTIESMHHDIASEPEGRKENNPAWLKRFHVLNEYFQLHKRPIKRSGFEASNNLSAFASDAS